MPLHALADGVVPRFPFWSTFDPAICNTADNVGSNMVQAMRVRCAGPADVTIDAIGLEVVASTGNIAVGIFRNSGTGRSAVPAATPVAYSTVAACPAAGYHEIALNTAIEPEPDDWYAIFISSATATFRCASAAAMTNDLLGGLAALDGSATDINESMTWLTGKNSGNTASICLIGIPA